VQGGLRSVPSVSAFIDNTPPEPPGAPTALVATVSGTTTRTVQLAWNAPAVGDPATGYFVDRSADGAPPLRLTPAPIAGRTYTDATPPLASLCYSVTAITADGLTGPASAPACVVVGTPPPDAPQNVSVALRDTGNQVLVHWTPAATGTPAAFFDVYRSANGATPVRVNASPVPRQSMFDFWIDAALPSGTLCYRVSALDAQLHAGAMSAPACLSLLPAPPLEPQVTTLELVTVPGGSLGNGAWRFDEGGGQVVNDVSLHGHYGTLGDSPIVDPRDPQWSTGVNGAALTFDGVDDRVTVASAADLEFSSTFTVEAWVRRASFGAPQCVLSKGDNPSRNFWVLLDASDHIEFGWQTAAGATHGVTSTATIGDSSWHHVACVYDAVAGQDRIYLDGALVKSAADSGTPATGADPLYIGARLAAGTPKTFFNGSIDQVRVAPRALYVTNFTPQVFFPNPSPERAVHVAWESPASGPPAAYRLYRQSNAGPIQRLDVGGIAVQSYLDFGPPAGTACYYLTAVDAYGQEGPRSAPRCIVLTPPSTSDSTAPAPRWNLDVGPNPFNPTLGIRFTMSRDAAVALVVYDVRGQRVATLVSARWSAGVHAVTWNGRDDHGAAVGSGVYFVSLESDSVRLRKKVALVH